MARLSTRLCSLLTDKVIEDLKTNEIITVDNFIAAVQSGRIFSCQLLSLSEQEIHILNKILVVMFGQLPQSTAELEERQAASLTLSTGIERIDSLLEGGITTGTVIELLGPGTAEFCLNFISTILLSSANISVVYIDSWYGFNAGRLKHKLRTKLPNEDINSLLNRVVLFTTTDIFQLLSCISIIKDKLSSEILEEHDIIKVIVIDSMIDLLLPVTGYDREVSKLLKDIFSTLRLLASNHTLSILYTSTPNPFHYGRQLKEEWANMSDITIRLEQENVTVTKKEEKHIIIK